MTISAVNKKVLLGLIVSILTFPIFFNKEQTFFLPTDDEVIEIAPKSKEVGIIKPNYDGIDAVAYFQNKYEKDPEWNNMYIYKFHKKGEDGFSVVEDIVKQVNLYFKNPSLLSMFPDLRSRIFPFLSPELPTSWPTYQNTLGVVLTCSKKEIRLVKKLIRVIRLMSDIEIEVLHANELPDDLDFGDKVRIINISKYLRPGWKPITYMNKWMAILFSSFQEVVLMDADVVPFVSPEEFFKIYDGSTLLFPDRRMNARLGPSCYRVFDRIPKLEFSPTTLEGYEDAAIRKQFFQSKEKENIDSGVVVTNKESQFPSLMMGTMLNMIGTVSDCLFGDKENFWLGHIFMAQPVSINPQPVGVVGEINNGKICSAQQVHVSPKGALLWVNGGLEVCKITDAWLVIPEMYQEKYPTTEALKEYYTSPIKLEAVVLAHPVSNPWQYTKGCHMRMMCLNSNAPQSLRVKYNGVRREVMDRIVRIWFGEEHDGSKKFLLSST